MVSLSMEGTRTAKETVAGRDSTKINPKWQLFLKKNAMWRC